MVISPVELEDRHNCGTPSPADAVLTPMDIEKGIDGEILRACPQVKGLIPDGLASRKQEEQGLDSTQKVSTDEVKSY